MPRTRALVGVLHSLLGLCGRNFFGVEGGSKFVDSEEHIVKNGMGLRGCCGMVHVAGDSEVRSLWDRQLFQVLAMIHLTNLIHVEVLMF